MLCILQPLNEDELLMVMQPGDNFDYDDFM